MRTLLTTDHHAILLLPVAAGLLTILLASSAAARENEAEGSSANTVLALDVNFAAPLRLPGADFGGGGAVRLGRKLDFLLVSLTPEIGVGYDGFKSSNGAMIYRGFIGARLGFGKVVEPSVYAHIGVGRLDASFGSHTASTLDGGVALDLTFLPLINLGVHASYNTLLAQGNYSSLDWLSLGIHAALEF